MRVRKRALKLYLILSLALLLTFLLAGLTKAQPIDLPVWAWKNRRMWP